MPCYTDPTVGNRHTHPNLDVATSDQYAHADTAKNVDLLPHSHRHTDADCVTDNYPNKIFHADHPAHANLNGQSFANGDG